MSLTHGMEEIGPPRTAVAPARQVNSTRVEEHRYTKSRTLLSALDRAVHFALPGSGVQQNPDARTPEITSTMHCVAQ